jgi:hypothetical protein
MASLALNLELWVLRLLSTCGKTAPTMRDPFSDGAPPQRLTMGGCSEKPDHVSLYTARLITRPGMRSQS